jgi:NitT/TauT family transport system permease protein
MVHQEYFDVKGGKGTFAAQCGNVGCADWMDGSSCAQLLISIVKFGALIELYSANFLMGHFWAPLLVLVAMAFTISELIAYLARRVANYATKR